jgi:hypothetical protein
LDSALMPPTRLLLLGDEEDMERKMQLQARHRVGFLATDHRTNGTRKCNTQLLRRIRVLICGG